MKKLTMDELNRASVETFKQVTKHPVVVVLDNIRSLHNVGAAFRTSDAFLIEKICLCGITGTPPNREIHKTALGSTESVNWEYFAETIQAIQTLREEGYTIVAVEQTDMSVQLNQFQMEKGQQYAFVFGNEAFGIDESVLPLCDLSVEIPQFGTKHSLNVSVAMGIILWQYIQANQLH
jgi:23S rRNA (guanosine2251-2'-O)-methyltransferase